MSKTLGGFLFFKDAEKYDYCYRQSIESLLQCCDKVCVAYFWPSEDSEEVHWVEEKVFKPFSKHLHAQRLPSNMWLDMKGKTKLSNFQNIAAMMLDTDYQILCQADEVVTEESYLPIRQAMETGGEGFLCERVNLWGDPNHMLVVPQNRQPCSTQVIRLTKRGYWCYDDGENIGAPASAAFVDKIKIIHYGFVRKREVMKSKIINMQESIFLTSHDPKLDECDIFNPELWFSGADLATINFTHPAIMQKWILDRM